MGKAKVISLAHRRPGPGSHSQNTRQYHVASIPPDKKWLLESLEMLALLDFLRVLRRQQTQQPV
ncbi:MAG: hypothetical protein JRH08_11075 [Deltaproteobacteria bacterium]|nr:hypothetical protein [Deltaproteobacteria bacterium]MBW1928031.1 hypothetical protein [Deltaproteobacteria bacterium]MBW2024979.1 hypothetical protein [Deltaproteobacteria bacterium]MBW2126217.1 hypothetical protein [Deltaproteobacteria bacterium]